MQGRKGKTKDAKVKNKGVRGEAEEALFIARFKPPFVVSEAHSDRARRMDDAPGSCDIAG